MYQGRTVFSQILDFLPMHKFRQCVNRYNGNKGVRTFTCPYFKVKNKANNFLIDTILSNVLSSLKWHRLVPAWECINGKTRNIIKRENKDG